MDSELKELRVSNDAMLDGDELRRRLADEGYLFFKKLQDPDKMFALRREMLTVMQQGGWLLPDTDPMDGIADVSRVCTEGDEGYTDVYHKVYNLESFHRSAHLPEIMDMITAYRRASGVAASAEDRPPVVPAIHRAHHAHPPGLRPLPGQLRYLDVLGPCRRLPRSSWVAWPSSPVRTRSTACSTITFRWARAA